MIRILKEAETNRGEIFAREDPVDSVEEPVRAILAQVKARGDEALKEYTKAFDGVELTSLEVGPGAVDEGFRSADPLLVEILYRAAERIAAFHQHQVRNSFLVNEEDGILMGQKVLPLARVGLYVPGGTAAYPSSVLMNCIPAKLAGVKEICMVTPPGKNGKIPPNILAAARICGVDRVFAVGGAQAVAALAYGTGAASPGWIKLWVPATQFVAEAKKQVFGQVGIDMVAGPSEILVIADRRMPPGDRGRRPAQPGRTRSQCLRGSGDRQRGAGRGRPGRRGRNSCPELLRKDIARASMLTATARLSVAQSLEHRCGDRQ